ncbi:MAG: ATP-dependent zinc metalloprotease FtsH [Patescibacteria group bacterium]
MSTSKQKNTTKQQKDSNSKIPNHFPSKRNLPQQPPLYSNIFFYVFLILGLYVLVGAYNEVQANKDTRPINEVIKLINEEKVQNVTVADNSVEVLLRDGTSFESQKEAGVSFDEILSNNNVDVSKIAGEFKVEERLEFLDILSPLLAFGLPILLIFFIFRQMRGAGSDIMSFGRSKAKLFAKGKQSVGFDAVAGVEEAKTELMEVVDFLKQPAKYRKLGARIPKGILLVGPSGVGKTLLAKAVAGEAGVPFFSIAGSEFMEMLVGVGSARARDLFKMAKENQPSLVFIDEIDAIGRQRGMGLGGGHDEREQTLNQILVEMDGFDARATVIVMGATNRPDMLDPALVRPGRFDRRITVTLPDLDDRMAILKIHMKGKPFEDSVNMHAVAKNTVGFSGADLENMLNEAAILAARAGKTKISDIELEEAALKVTIGSERKTMQSEEEKKMTAYHEAGHALVASNQEEMDPVHRVTIVARGGSLGHTAYPPQRDRYGETNTRLLAMITSALAGKAAEELVYGVTTTGASNDIERATQLARAMVREYGMSSLGPIAYHERAERNWIAKELGSTPPYSEAMAAKIDAEVAKIMENSYKDALSILKKHRKTLDAIVEALMQTETLTADEYNKILESNGSTPINKGYGQKSIA